MRIFGYLLKKKSLYFKKKEKKVSYFSMDIPYLPLSIVEAYPLEIFT